MKSVLHDLYAACVEWRGARSSLPNTERRSFSRWVARAHPEIATEFRGEPARFHAVCHEVERGMHLPRRPGIGSRVLERHMPVLAARWLALAHVERETFPAFLDRVLREYPTPRTLERYVRSFEND